MTGHDIRWTVRHRLFGRVSFQYSLKQLGKFPHQTLNTRPNLPVNRGSKIADLYILLLNYFRLMCNILYIKLSHEIWRRTSGVANNSSNVCNVETRFQTIVIICTLCSCQGHSCSLCYSENVPRRASPWEGSWPGRCQGSTPPPTATRKGRATTASCVDTISAPSQHCKQPHPMVMWCDQPTTYISDYIKSIHLVHNWLFL